MYSKLNPKPILFNTEMVKSTLSGQRTAIRLLIKPQPVGQVCHMTGYKTDYWAEKTEVDGNTQFREMKMQYKPGDILYVRETWAPDPFGTGYIYPTEFPGSSHRWNPSVFMPKEAARLFLEVKSVEAQRLQDFLSCRDEIIKEGVPFENYDAAAKHFKSLWDSTVKADKLKYGFDANPWVWAIEFERFDMKD